ncbi:GNAT family N-acetyltransferase [Sagittula salina]|uniref:GNAT family N-acetyltransferase n=1 Tax=Sagittula salina TaxID=2820268 RepID=A0A940ML24_9RHOB|nr:GNAT family N-acetyltransferase [Sagittula salina]MBP0481558.1 GNAT family N-acetyltransferase [Sagittula salina]
MIRKAGMQDAGAIAAFLEGRIETSMFLLGNLEEHGTDNRDHPYGTAFFLRETGEGITGVFGATNGGSLMCQLPGLSTTEAQTYAHLLKGYSMQAITGEAGQVAVLIDALPVPEDAWRLNQVQPLYRRRLAGLVSHDTTRLVAPGDVDRLTDWFARYLEETQTAPPGDVTDAAQQRAEASVGAPHIRLLVEGGEPTAMAAMNAQAGTALQVGGVFVPPELRGMGRGGRVVAALLAEAASNGAELAILFAASPQAAQVYERIGFERCGDYRVAVLNRPVTLENAT